jgi:parallel beta-helix repeat protein
MPRSKFIAILTTAVFLSASAFAGTTYAVGTCLPKLPFFTTISQAVSSVPSGSTIEVCPGNYAEQVVITQPLTLKGVSAGGSDAAVVAVPATGLVNTVLDLNPPLTFPIAYQILVQSTGPVNISNLVVDGTSVAPPVSPTPVYVAGIFYQDSSGTVSEVSARYQTNVMFPGYGIGILATINGEDAQTVAVQNSVVHDFDSSGIAALTVAGPLTANIKANTVHSKANFGIAFQNAAGTVQSNEISGGPAIGLVLLYSSVTATGNTIITLGTGVYVWSGSNSIKSNRIDANDQYGVQLGDSVNNSEVQSNTIVNSSTAVSGCNGTFPASGFTVTGNTITDAAIGIQVPLGNTTTPNAFYATTSVEAACP